MNFVIHILLSVSGLSKSLLSFLHFRNIISDIAAGLREGCFCVLYISSSLISHSAGHQSKCPEVISIEWMADNNLVCCVIIRAYWCHEQLGVRCVCVVHRPRIVLVLLLDTNVSMIACIFGRWFFHSSDLVRDLFSITLRFQTPLLSTLSYLWSTFHYFLCLSWFFFSSFFVPFVVALLPSKAGNLRRFNCFLACSRITGTKCAVSHHQLMLNHVTAWCRQKRWKDLVHILLAKRSTLKVSAVGFNRRRSLSLVNMLLTSKFWYQLCLLQILLQDMIPPEQNSSLIPNAESENASEDLTETSKKKISDLAQIAFLRIEQVRFKLARLGKSRSLHEVFEGNRHFYYPQRLLISFSLSLVGAVFFLAVFMYLISELCKILTSWRKQILNILAQVDSFIGAAPTYVKLMSSGLVSGLAGALTSVSLASWRVTWITRSRWWCYWYWFASLGFFFFAARGQLCNCVQCPSIVIPALPWRTWVISLILCFIAAGHCPVY